MSTIAAHIEQTILKPETRLEDVKLLCEQAKQYGFGGICIPPLFVRDARRMLDELSPRTRVVTVVGFPMGYSAIAAKSEEIKRATEDGADEIDAVINIAAVKSGNWNHVANDIEAMSLATNMRGRSLKLILECGLLTPDEIQRLCVLAAESRINWLKTGTGFHGHPATVEMVRSLRTMAPATMRIKAAGGIRTLADAQALLDAGAERIGTSAGVDMVTASR
jgi:deoxyribose-phosphate aldolase